MEENRYLARLARALGGMGGAPRWDRGALGLEAGTELVTPVGPCLVLVSEALVDLALPRRAEAAAAVARALSLLFGVGPVREGGLRDAGAQTMADLIAHPRYGSEAGRWLADLEEGDLPTLYNRISQRFSASHDLLLALLAFADREELVFLDIETLGLSALPAFLLGVGRLTERGLEVRQYFARGPGEEPAVLAALHRELPPRPIVVSYNGKAYDWNHLQARCAYHGVDSLPDPLHLDLLYFARRRWGAELLDCSLAVVEEAVLGVKRGLDVPGEYVPDLYSTYLRTGSVEPLLPVIAHNRDDVVSLVRILSLLLRQVTGSG